MRIAYNVIEDKTSSVVTERIRLLNYWQITGMSQEGKKGQLQNWLFSEFAILRNLTSDFFYQSKTISRKNMNSLE